MSIFDAEMVARYDVSGPRYTSYPSAPQFHNGFGEVELRAAAKASNAKSRRLSLYVHIPFCMSPCFYCGCTRIITRDPGRADEYLARLTGEIEMTAALFGRERPVVQMHFGGGTPNFLGAPQMAALLDRLDRHFSLSRDAGREFGVELDPRFAGPAYVRMLAEHGFNRLSIGIQDFDPLVQAAVNRLQSVAETRTIIDAAREAGFRSVSVDLIYGLPRQTPERFADTLAEVIALGPDRVATYGYAHLPSRFKAQRQINAAELPAAGTRLALLALSIEALTEAGYRYIGMDHFALPGDDLAQAQVEGTLQRNFQGYSTHAECDLIGLGMSSISHVGDTFSQNAKDLNGYYGALDAGRLPVERGLMLSEDDRIRADLIQCLMCAGVLDIPSFEARHRIDARAYFTGELVRLEHFERDGLVVIQPDRIEVTPRGRYLLRNIAMCFDAYLDEPAVGHARYSRAL